MHDDSSQYQPAYLQGHINQQWSPRNALQMAYNAPKEPLSMPHYQSRQPTAAEVLSKQFDIPQSYTAGDNIRVSESGVMPQPDSTPLYPQCLQYGPTTNLATLASSDSRTSPEIREAAGATPTDQQQREIDNYGHTYGHLSKTNENTSQGRLVTAAKSLFEISKCLFTHGVSWNSLIANLSKDLRRMTNGCTTVASP